MTDLVKLRILEFHVVHHCNLTCVGCSHFSPTSPTWLVAAQDLERDVELAAARLAPEYIHVLGGEPLLHPDLEALLPIVRRGFPLATIKLVSNGVLVPRRADTLFPVLTDNAVLLSVSIYPRVKTDRERIAELGTQHRVEVEFWVQNTFLDFIDPLGQSNPAESRAACPMQDACNVRDGRLYPCPVTAWADFGHLPFSVENGVDLRDSPDAIRSVLDRGKITTCCRFCIASPERVPHTLGKPERIRSIQ